MKKLSKFVKNNTKVIIAFILGAVIFSGVGITIAGTVASSSITYTNNSQSTVEGALNDLYGKAEKVNFYESILSNIEIDTSSLKIGDTVNYSVTGNEGEISEWVVIKEGTEPELVAKTQSPNTFTLSGQNGYLNAIKYLNDEAASYGTDKAIVKATRHMGYSNQTESCTDLASCPTDSGSSADQTLVKAAMNDTVVTENNYWLSTRCTTQNLGTVYVVGVVAKNIAACNYGFGLYGRGENTRSYSIRPIITLQSNVKFTVGSSANTYDIKISEYKYWTDNYSGTQYASTSVPNEVYPSYESLSSAGAIQRGVFIRTLFNNGNPIKHELCIAPNACAGYGFWESIVGSTTQSVDNANAVKDALYEALKGYGSIYCSASNSYVRCQNISDLNFYVYNDGGAYVDSGYGPVCRILSGDGTAYCTIDI